MSKYIRFSERVGLTEPRKILSKDEVPERLKNRIWNTISYNLLNEIALSDNTAILDLYLAIYGDFFGKENDFLASYGNTPSARIREEYKKLEKYEVYDFIDFVLYHNGKSFMGDKTIHKLNIIFSEELSPYRFVDNQLLPITNEEEIAEIEKVKKQSRDFGLENVLEHLRQSIISFSNRKNPDYRNSIKESISAIEAICKIITDDKNTTLGKALNKIKKDSNYNQALISGFINIYGFANRESGIRHALADKDKIKEEDARYFLISSSAFINYLIVKANNQGLIKESK